MAKLKDGTAQKKATQLINNYIKRTGDGRLVPDDSGAYFRELETRQNERYLDEFKTGAPS